MPIQKIALLHPGAMGSAVAGSAIHSGNAVYWTSEGRSAATKERAAQYKLRDAGTLANLCTTCNILLSICPPHAAEDIAHQVVASGFHGLYLDANAISPQRAVHIGEMLNAAGIAFVDGGIIGGPPTKPGETWLSLSGPRAQEIADCFAAGPLAVNIIGDEIGKASALKMCYAAYSKGTTALLAAILSASDQLGIRNELYQEWERDARGMGRTTEQRVIRSTAKAWRFEGEMQEIAATFEAVNLPPGFHQAAAEIYHRLAPLKDAAETPSLAQILQELKQ